MSFPAANPAPEVQQLIQSGNKASIQRAIDLAQSHAIDIDWQAYEALFDWLAQAQKVNQNCSTLADKIAQLLQLRSLEMSNQQLKSIPFSIGCLSNLMVLDFSKNELTTIPKSIGRLSSLTTLMLQENQLVELQPLGTEGQLLMIKS